VQLSLKLLQRWLQQRLLQRTRQLLYSAWSSHQRDMRSSVIAGMSALCTHRVKITTNILTPLLNLPSRLLAALTFAIVKSQRIAGCCHLANSAEAYPQLPKPSNFYYILGGAARCKRRRRLIFQWSFRVFSFDATTQQRLDGFSPNLHQKTSLRC